MVASQVVEIYLGIRPESCLSLEAEICNWWISLVAEVCLSLEPENLVSLEAEN